MLYLPSPSKHPTRTPRAVLKLHILPLNDMREMPIKRCAKRSTKASDRREKGIYLSQTGMLAKWIKSTVV